MSNRVKKLLVIGTLFVALLFVIVALRPDIFGFFAMQADGIMHAGTWEDDPQNWYRAFKAERPAEVKVVHSKYWRSSHFTTEFIYHFEIEATADWRDAFLRKRGLTQVSPSATGSFGTNTQSDITPDWFAPGPVELYEVWDKDGYIGFGSVWINKTNGHIYLYDALL